MLSCRYALTEAQRELPDPRTARHALRRLLVEASIYHKKRGSTALVCRLLDMMHERNVDPREIEGLGLNRREPRVGKAALLRMFADLDYIIDNYEEGVVLAFVAVNSLRLWDLD